MASFFMGERMDYGLGIIIRRVKLLFRSSRKAVVIGADDKVCNSQIALHTWDKIHGISLIKMSG
jgi:hypothetical protein